MIRIVIADDHSMMRACLKQIIGSAGDMEVVGEAASGTEAMGWVRNAKFDVLLLDMNMPGPSGVELITRILIEKPALPILVLSMLVQGELVARTLKAGAMGYVAKDSEPGVLLSALRQVAAGRRSVDPCLVTELVFESVGAEEQPHRTLSNREFQVLQAFLQGKSVTEMAEAFRLSAKTISTHKANIKEKLGVRADADLIRYAIDHRL